MVVKISYQVYIFPLKNWTIKYKHNGKKWKGPLQYENNSGELMMLPSCMAMIKDEKMLEYVKMYAEDQVIYKF